MILRPEKWSDVIRPGFVLPILCLLATAALLVGVGILLGHFLYCPLAGTV